MYIQVSHTNGRSIKNMIGAVVNRLMGMGLKGYLFPLSTTTCADHQQVWKGNKGKPGEDVGQLGI